MRIRSLVLTAVLMATFWGLTGCNRPAETREEAQPVGWKQHDMSRPKPEVIAPAGQVLPVPPPQGAVVLFDGTNLSGWETPEGDSAAWKVENGYMEVTAGKGAIQTKEKFGDVQLHVEWASPVPPMGEGQDRGNSGIFLMGIYEVQVLDSYNSETYADGQAGAIYGQYPPLFNALRPTGEWQSYDIIFRRPHFAADSSLTEPARITVIVNGIVVQANEELQGLTAWLKTLPYSNHGDEGPIQLQDHGSPVRFRNIWAVRIPERPAPDAQYASKSAPIEMSSQDLDKFAGVYNRGDESNPAPITITRQGDHLEADFYYRPGTLSMVPVSENTFVLTETDARVVFDLNDQKQPTGLTFEIGGARMPARKVQ